MVRGLRFYRSSIRRVDEGGTPMFLHGQIEPDRSDFDLIFRPLYPRYEGKFMLSAHEIFSADTQEESLANVQRRLVWANGRTSLMVHDASALDFMGPTMEEFQGKDLLIWNDLPHPSMTWQDYLGIVYAPGERRWPPSLHCLLHCWDGIYWEIFTTDESELRELLKAHRDRAALQIFHVDFALDYPNPVRTELKPAT